MKIKSFTSGTGNYFIKSIRRYWFIIDYRIFFHNLSLFKNLIQIVGRRRSIEPFNDNQIKLDTIIRNKKILLKISLSKNLIQIVGRKRSIEAFNDNNQIKLDTIIQNKNLLKSF